MSFGQKTVTNILLDVFRKLEKANFIRNSLAAFEDASGDFFLGKRELARKALIRLCLFYGIKIGSLYILNDSKFELRSLVGLSNNDRHPRKTGATRRAKAPFAGKQLALDSASVGKINLFLRNNERLQDAVLPDGIGERSKFLLVKIVTGLMGVWLYLI